MIFGAEFMEGGLITALRFMAIMNLSLAVFNMLPLPPLDGKKVALNALMAISPKFGGIFYPAHALGWLILVGLIVYATVNDIGRVLS